MAHARGGGTATHAASPSGPVLCSMTNLDESLAVGKGSVNPATRLDAPRSSPYHGRPRSARREGGLRFRYPLGDRLNREENVKHLTRTTEFVIWQDAPEARLTASAAPQRHRTLKDWKHSEPSSAATAATSVAVERTRRDKSTRTSSEVRPKSSTAGCDREVTATRSLIRSSDRTGDHSLYYGEFDPGSGRTLAAGLTHASRTRSQGLPWWKVAHG